MVESGGASGAQRFAEQAVGDLLLARLREEAGDAAHAERLYQLAADAGHANLGALTKPSESGSFTRALSVSNG